MHPELRVSKTLTASLRTRDFAVKGPHRRVIALAATNDTNLDELTLRLRACSRQQAKHHAQSRKKLSKWSSPTVKIMKLSVVVN